MRLIAMIALIVVLEFVLTAVQIWRNGWDALNAVLTVLLIIMIALLVIELIRNKK